MGVKQFKTTGRVAKKAGAEDEKELWPLEFKIDDGTYRTVTPKKTQLVWLVAAGSTHSSEADQVAAVVDFIDGILEPDSARRFRTRLLKPGDPLDVEHVVAIMEWMIEEWGGSPPTSADG